MHQLVKNGLICIGVLLLAVSLDRLYTPDTTSVQLDAVTTYSIENNKPTPPLPFTHDGCTLFPNTFVFAFLQEPCFMHDIAYYYGGTSAERKVVDVRLRHDAAASGWFGNLLSYPIYIGVRIFGDTPLTKLFNAHWGYGHD